MNTIALFTGFKLAMAEIRVAKMRSFLTVLGVIIGTGTIIGVGSIITGLDGAITNIIKSFGSDNMIVFKFRGGFRVGNLTPEEWKRKPLSYENARVIEERCPSVLHANPYLFPDNRSFRNVKYKGNELYRINIGGTEEGYVNSGVEMMFGRFFTDVENRHHLPVAVIGENVYNTLFQKVD